MSNKKKLNEEYTGLKTIKTLIETYQEIAAIRMQKVRSTVLANRAFLEELNEIYRQLRYSYQHQLTSSSKNNKSLLDRIYKDNENKPLIKRNGKTTVVFLSSNTGLYGDIIRKTFNRFSKFVSENENVDISIVGRRGLAYFKEVYTNRKYTYYDLEDHIVTSKDVSDVVNKLIKYEKVVVFHGKYQSILSQIPTKSNISGEFTFKKEEQKQQAQVSFIFEPSLEQILAFFETEIMASIFEQTVNESNLSKFAARMISLDSSVVSISDKLKKVKFSKQQIKHREFNRKQLTTIAGVSLWQK